VIGQPPSSHSDPQYPDGVNQNKIVQEKKGKVLGRSRSCRTFVREQGCTPVTLDLLSGGVKF
jgi:hypothetical protein